MVLYALFGLAPLFMSLFAAVFEFGYYGEGWIGFAAFREVFTDQTFWGSVWVTVKFTAVLFPSSMLMAIAFAVVLSWAGNKLQSFARMAFYVPCIVSVVMVSFVWRWLVLPGGPLSLITGDILLIGSNPYAFWMVCVMVLTVTLGQPMIFMMAAFLSVDSEISEAARLDGCSKVQEAWYITIPMIMPVLTYLGISRFVGFLQLWEFPYAVTGGGPNYATTPILLLIYQEAAVKGNIAHASVMTLFLLVFVVVILLAYRAVSGRRLLF